MALDQGTTFSGYRVEGILGQGGMGVVYEATQLSLNRTVALKLLATNLGDDDAFRERFRREGLLQAAIEHPNIVTVYEAGESDEGLFMAMRLVRGPNLKDMILSRELDAGRTLRILRPIADALDTAHEAGLIHRDIKPQNILVGARDHAYLADFGLTKAAGEKGLTKTGQFVGTLDYISPEQIRGLNATAASDIYALTSVLYECLTGIVPYPKDSEAAVLYAHMSDDPPTVTRERPELPAPLDAVIQRGMAKEPGDRPATAAELLDAAEGAFGPSTRAAIQPPGPIASPEDAGIRRAEVDVDTRGAQSQDSEQLATQLGGVAPTAAGQQPDATRLGAVEGTQVAAAATRMGTGPAADTASLPGAGDTPAGGTPVAGRGRSATAPLVAGVAVAVLALAVIGFLIGRGGGGDSQPAGTTSARSGAVTITYPESWERYDQVPQLPRYKLTNPIVAGPKGRAEDRLTTGLVDAGGATLLPAAFVKALGADPSRGDTVRLGSVQAYRYRGLDPGNFDPALTLYAVPTDKGVATIACQADAARAERFMSECERAASTIQLDGAKPFDLGPGRDYVDRVNGAVDDVQTARGDGIDALKGATTPAQQADAAAGVARAYGGAAKALDGDAVSPQVAATNDAIVAALRDASAAWGRVADGAKSADAAGYKAGGRAVTKAEKQLSAALRQLGQQS